MYTFIVLSYNQEDYIIDCLNSIKNQVILYGENKSIELIIADDGSTDKTRQVSQEWLTMNKTIFSNVITIFEDTNIGVSKNYYRAIEKSTNNKIKVIAADDIFATNNIMKYFDFLDQYDIVFGNANVFGEDYTRSQCKIAIDRYRKFMKTITVNNFNKKLIIENFIQAPTVFINKNVVLKYKPEVCEHFRNMEDYPTWLNLFYKEVVRWKYVDDIIVNYRNNLNSISKGYKEKFVKDIIYLLEYKLSFDVSFAQRIIIKSEKLYFRKILSHKYKLLSIINLNNLVRLSDRIKSGFIKLESTLDVALQENIEYCEKLIIHKLY